MIKSVLRRLMAIVLSVTLIVGVSPSSVHASNDDQETVTLMLNGDEYKMIFEDVDENARSITEYVNGIYNETVYVEKGDSATRIYTEDRTVNCEIQNNPIEIGVQPLTTLTYVKKGTIIYNYVDVESVQVRPQIEFWYATGEIKLNSVKNLNEALGESLSFVSALILGSITFISGGIAAALASSLVSMGVVSLSNGVIYLITRNEVTVNSTDYYCKGKYNGNFCYLHTGQEYYIIDENGTLSDPVYEGMCPQEWTAEYNAQSIYGDFLTIFTYPGVFLYDWA